MSNLPIKTMTSKFGELMKEMHLSNHEAAEVAAKAFATLYQHLIAEARP